MTDPKVAVATRGVRDTFSETSQKNAPPRECPRHTRIWRDRPPPPRWNHTRNILEHHRLPQPAVVHSELFRQLSVEPVIQENQLWSSGSLLRAGVRPDEHVRTVGVAVHASMAEHLPTVRESHGKEGVVTPAAMIEGELFAHFFFPADGGGEWGGELRNYELVQLYSTGGSCRHFPGSGSRFST